MNRLSLDRVWPLFILVAGLVLGLAIILYLRAGFDDIHVAFVELLLWQGVVWSPWLVAGWGLVRFAEVLPFSALSLPRWLGVQVVTAVVLAVLHYAWFRAVSSSLSPFLGLPNTRYGVFAYFFIFWSTLDLVLYGLIVAYANGRGFYVRNRETENRLAELAKAGAEHLREFTVRKANRRHLVQASDVQWIEADGYYAKLHTGDGSYLLRESLGKLDEQLDPQQFVRVHRSTIVNTAFVKHYGPTNNGNWTLTLTDGVERRVSRSGRQRLETRFG